MKLKIDEDECWIKDNSELPSSFNQMDDYDKCIWNNNLLHKVDGPAIIYSNGTKEWRINGKLHRLNGPAIIWSDGDKTWWLNDIRVDEEIYEKIQGSSKEELLVYMALTEYKDFLPLIEYRLNQA